MSKSKIVVSGYYSTKFGELWNRSLSDLIIESVEGLLVEAKTSLNKVEAIFFGNMLSGILENNLHLGAKIAEIFKLNIPIFRVESACSSGGMAFHLAYNYLKANHLKNVLVLGVEKMTDATTELVTHSLASAASGMEQEAGLTFPGLYAIIAQNYLTKFGYTEKDLAQISVKNHYHGSLNDKAQFRNQITVDQVMNSQYIASPLKVLDCSPITDGGAAIMISSEPKNQKIAEILSTETATDTISLTARESLVSIKATELAAKKAFAIAKIKPKQIDIAEVHDCFSIAEVLALENLGFVELGQGAKFDNIKQTYLNSKNSKLPVVNTSGGLKAAGHPVGATGIKQIGEVYLQLTNQAKSRQIKKAEYGLAHNVGGSGGSSSVTILSKNNT